MRRFRIKSHRTDSHFIQKRYLGFLWLTPWSIDTRFETVQDAIQGLREHVESTCGYPRVSKIITEDEVWR